MSVSVPGLAPACLPARSTMLAESEREREPQGWSLQFPRILTVVLLSMEDVSLYLLCAQPFVGVWEKRQDS